VLKITSGGRVRIRRCWLAAHNGVIWMKNRMTPPQLLRGTDIFFSGIFLCSWTRDATVQVQKVEHA
jgi:hypothetical protein